MTPALTKEEQDFVRWMDELDLDEVNLLEVTAADGPAPSQQDRDRLSGERRDSEPPPSRGVGWDEG